MRTYIVSLTHEIYVDAESEEEALEKAPNDLDQWKCVDAQVNEVRFKIVPGKEKSLKSLKDQYLDSIMETIDRRYKPDDDKK